MGKKTVPDNPSPHVLVTPGEHLGRLSEVLDAQSQPIRRASVLAEETRRRMSAAAARATEMLEQRVSVLPRSYIADKIQFYAEQKTPREVEQPLRDKFPEAFKEALSKK